VAMELAVSKAVAPPSIGKPSRKTAKVIPHTASNNAVRSALERTTCFHNRYASGKQAQGTRPLSKAALLCYHIVSCNVHISVKH